MTVTDQIKILDRKTKQNEWQYNLDEEATKISALSSNNLDKYHLLIGEDLGLKPSTIEQAKYEYSPLGKIFNKGLSKEDKKEELFKWLKNIEDKNEKLLEVKNNTKGNKRSHWFRWSTLKSWSKRTNWRNQKHTKRCWLQKIKN